MAPSAGPAAANATGSGGPGSLALFLVIVVPGALLLLALVPEHRAAAAGDAGRMIVQGRVAFAAVGLAIWLGVFISMYLGGGV